MASGDPHAAGSRAAKGQWPSIAQVVVARALYEHVYQPEPAFGPSLGTHFGEFMEMAQIALDSVQPYLAQEIEHYEHEARRD